MNPDTQGTTNTIDFKKKNHYKPSTPHGRNNLSYKKLNHKITITTTILQLNKQTNKQTKKSDHVELHDIMIQRK